MDTGIEGICFLIITLLSLSLSLSLSLLTTHLSKQLCMKEDKPARQKQQPHRATFAPGVISSAKRSNSEGRSLGSIRERVKASPEGSPGNLPAKSSTLHNNTPNTHNNHNTPNNNHNNPNSNTGAKRKSQSHRIPHRATTTSTRPLGDTGEFASFKMDLSDKMMGLELDKKLQQRRLKKVEKTQEELMDMLGASGETELKSSLFAEEKDVPLKKANNSNNNEGKKEVGSLWIE